MELVLSLFPGVDLLGRAFEAAGFCVVRGPDKIFDQLIEDFHAPPGLFAGVIGGPPCTNYSDANRRRDTDEGDRLVRHFLRVVDESRPSWWLMENVRNVPDVQLRHYAVQRLDAYDPDFGGTQSRLRHIQFGSLTGDIIRPARTTTPRRVTPVPTVTTAPSSPHDRHARRLAKQGFGAMPLRMLTVTARRRVIGNGVPWSIGHTLAQAVARRGPVTAADCCCGCGRPVKPPATHAGDACRQRTSRRRRGHARCVTIEQSHPIAPIDLEDDAVWAGHTSADIPGQLTIEDLIA